MTPLTTPLPSAANRCCLAAMELVVNGERKQVPGAHNVEELLRALELPAERVAVELNGEIVPRAARQAKTLKDGDVVELVTLVGGG